MEKAEPQRIFFRVRDPSPISSLPAWLPLEVILNLWPIKSSKIEHQSRLPGHALNSLFIQDPIHPSCCSTHSLCYFGIWTLHPTAFVFFNKSPPKKTSEQPHCNHIDVARLIFPLSTSNTLRSAKRLLLRPPPLGKYKRTKRQPIPLLVYVDDLFLIPLLSLLYFHSPFFDFGDPPTFVLAAPHSHRLAPPLFPSPLPFSLSSEQPLRKQNTTAHTHTHTCSYICSTHTEQTNKAPNGEHAIVLKGPHRRQ